MTRSSSSTGNSGGAASEPVSIMRSKPSSPDSGSAIATILASPSPAAAWYAAARNSGAKNTNAGAQSSKM